jgi:hypothetical protein
MIPAELLHHPELIAAIENLVHRLDGAIEQIKADVQLVDGSRLHINEVYIHGELRKYACYSWPCDGGPSIDCRWRPISAAPRHRFLS